MYNIRDDPEVSHIPKSVPEHGMEIVMRSVQPHEETLVFSFLVDAMGGGVLMVSSALSLAAFAALWMVPSRVESTSDRHGLSPTI